MQGYIRSYQKSLFLKCLGLERAMGEILIFEGGDGRAAVDVLLDGAPSG